MAIQRNFNLQGLNLKLSAFANPNTGELTRCVNLENDMVGAKKKRPGYNTYLTSLGLEVTSLFNWTKNSGTQFWNYAVAGGTLFYSEQGTGAWTVCGNGTLTNGARPGYAVLEETLVIGDGTAVTRHSTDGTSFTNTTSAPIANYFAEYQNRIYAGGTSSNLFYSTTGTPTDWQSDSSSLAIPGPGRINNVFKTADRLIASKNSGDMYRWDGYSLADLVTNLGPTTPYIPQVEQFRFLANRQGAFAFGGNAPEIVSNPVERQFYNDAGSGIVGTMFENMPAIVHRYDLLLGAGTVTDNLTDETLTRAVLKYDYQQDEWGNWQFANMPTAFGTYVDESKNRQLIFGDATGQCYTYGGTNTSDGGVAIEAVMEGVLHFGAPETTKQFNTIWAFANPGCEASVQVAVGNSFTKATKKWLNLGNFDDGVAQLRFPEGSEGRLLFWKVTESSKTTPFHFYGFSCSYDPIEGRE